MFILPTTRWSIPVMPLLLVMSTLQPFLLLPTVQSSVVHDNVRQIWQPSSNSSIITSSRILALGLLDQSTSSTTDMSPIHDCDNTLYENPIAQAAIRKCGAYQSLWLRLLWDENSLEHSCKKWYCDIYCRDLVARTYCTPDEYVALHNLLQQSSANNTKGRCKLWASWAPPFDAPPPPLITNATLQCYRNLKANGVEKICGNEVAYRIGMEHIEEPTERECKSEFELERCLTEKACTYCTDADEYLNFYASVWSPAKVECTKWSANDKPEMNCSAPTESPLLPSSLQVLTDKGEFTRCAAEAIVKYPNASLENACKTKYYEYDCGMKSACSLCTDTSDYVFSTQAELDSESEFCRHWSSEEPKLECPSELVPTGQPCVESFKANPNASSATRLCNEFQEPWLKRLLLNYVPEYGYEYQCKTSFTAAYCYNLVGRSFCTPDHYAEYGKVLQRALDAKAQYCKPWLDWAPPLDSPSPLPTMSAVEQCDDILFDGDGVYTCDKEESERRAEMDHIKDQTERACKEQFEMNKCLSREACKYCNESASAYVNFYGNLWSPSKVVCTKWMSEEPIKECTVNGTTESPPIPSPGSSSCLSLLISKGEDARCFAEAKAKYPNGSMENECNAAYYLGDCALKAACKLCSDTKEFVADARKDLELMRKDCKQWSSAEPKLECTSSKALLIVGIIIAVIAILGLIGVVVYFVLYFSSDKSGPSSSKGDGSHGSSNKPSTPKLGQAKSSVVAKQSSSA